VFCFLKKNGQVKKQGSEVETSHDPSHVSANEPDNVVNTGWQNNAEAAVLWVGIKLHLCRNLDFFKK
jgi:hypothetical protein